jgi:hypothetical protein
MCPGTCELPVPALAVFPHSAPMVPLAGPLPSSHFPVTKTAGAPPLRGGRGSFGVGGGEGVPLSCASSSLPPSHRFLSPEGVRRLFFPSALSFHALAVLERCTLLAPFCSYHRPLQGVSDSHCGLSPRPSIASDRRSRADESIGYRGALPAITPWLIAVNPRPRRPPVSASVISSCSSAAASE